MSVNIDYARKIAIDLVEEYPDLYRFAPNSCEYLVLSTGDVVSFKSLTPKFLELTSHTEGHRQVNLSGTIYRIDRLIAMVWVDNDNPEKHKSLIHIDGDYDNNSADNLRWINRDEYVKDRVKSGIIPNGQGIAKPVRDLVTGRTFDSVTEAAKGLGVTREMIYRYMKREQRPTDRVYIVDL